MHVLYVTASLPYSAGETYIVGEVLELQRQGHRVTLAPVRPLQAAFHADAGSLIDATLKEGILSLAVARAAIAECFHAPKRALRALQLIAASRNIKVLVKNLLVYPKGLWLGAVARANDIDHIHAHFASTPATVALIAHTVSGIPWSFTAHRWDITENNLANIKGATATFARAIDRRGATELADLMEPPSHRKVRLIHMGVDLPVDEPEPPTRQAGPLRVLMAARIDEFKGHHDAIEAIARLTSRGFDVILHCAGDGPARPAMMDIAARLGVLERCRFPGLVEHSALLTQLRTQAWDVALLPSVESGASREGIPVFLIEAMAAGIPVVATNTGGIPELIAGDGGILVPQLDPSAIADAIQLLAEDESTRRRLVINGYRQVRDHFSVEGSVSALITNLLGHSNASKASD